ncbi:uncharacterized protein LOC130892041 isoform X2 [Diorhabda carinulata]|uniref:uncharacterized protein LOC130892041 isoform X2 n=1 Tax=Diorhabda carinulata TaxID=1163345 RepID=UPI0025A0C558|nr:uncharacterized protein LOC130892041 isoform X2 [Diorhabda carinulata]
MSTYEKSEHLIIISTLAFMGIITVSQIFLVCYSRFTYTNFRKFIVAKGRLLQLVPVVTLSTVTSTVVDNVPYVLSRECQPTAPPPTQYTDPDISRTYGNKEMPPRYAA